MSRGDQLQRLLEADPNDAFLWYGLAQERAKLGDHAAACLAYDRALALDPAYHYAHFHKARSLAAAGHHHHALACAKQGLASARALRDLKAAGELEALVDELTDALEEGPA